MPDADKALRRHMHQEPADKLHPEDRKVLPSLAIFIVLNRKGDRVFIHAGNPVVADGNPVGILPEVAYGRLRPIEGLFTVGNPFPFSFQRPWAASIALYFRSSVESRSLSIS